VRSWSLFEQVERYALGTIKCCFLRGSAKGGISEHWRQLASADEPFDKISNWLIVEICMRIPQVTPGVACDRAWATLSHLASIAICDGRIVDAHFEEVTGIIACS
jgi:hypothetical protein